MIQKWKAKNCQSSNLKGGNLYRLAQNEPAKHE